MPIKGVEMIVIKEEAKSIEMRNDAGYDKLHELWNREQQDMGE